MDQVIAIADSQATVEALYRADAARLWRALVAFSHDEEIASDAVAEAYAQLLRRGSAVRDPGAWTWRTGFTLARAALKERGFGELSPVPATGHWDRHADPDLLTALQQLPDGQRAAVILFYYGDMPIREIGARLGSNPIAVRANLSRGRRRLRLLLGDRDA